MGVHAEQEPMLACAEDPEDAAGAPTLAAVRSGSWRWRRVAGAAVAWVALGLTWAKLPAGPGSSAARPSTADGLANVIGAAEEGHHHLDCSEYPYLKLLKVVRTNLGGKGPDTHAPPGLVYRGRVEGGDEDGKELEMHLNVTSDPAEFRPQSGKEIGFQGRYGSVNMKSNSSVTIEFQQYDPKERKHVPFDRLYLTFFDLDQGPDGTASESITVSREATAWLAKRSEVKASRLADGSLRFEATTEGTGDDNPKNPLALTQQQFQRAVTVLVENVTRFKVTFAVGDSPKPDPRWFNFRGQPTLLCARHGDDSKFELQELSGRSDSLSADLHEPSGGGDNTSSGHHEPSGSGNVSSSDHQESSGHGNGSSSKPQEPIDKSGARERRAGEQALLLAVPLLSLAQQLLLS